MITKFIEPWLLPPGIFIVLLAAVAVLLLGLRRRVGSHLDPGSRRLLAVAAWGVASIAVLVWALSTEIVSRELIGSLERRVPAASAADLARVDAVVALGGGVVTGFDPEAYLAASGGGAGFSAADTGTAAAARRAANVDALPAALGVDAQARLVMAARLAQELGVPLIVSGGTLARDGRVPAEADVARALAVGLGMAPDLVIIERESRTTAENAAFTRRLGYGPVALVTSAWHIPRSLLAFDRAGVAAVPVPAAHRAGVERAQARMVLPTAGAFHDSATALRERLGLLWYRVALR